MGRLALITAILASRAWAADGEAAIRTTFVQPWVDALRAGKPAQLEFLHPKVRACLNAGTREYFDSITKTALSGTTSPYRVTGVVAWNGPGPLWTLPPDGFFYPLQPQYELRLQFDEARTEVIRYLAPAGERWYVVVPCPNEKGMAYLREQKAAAKAQKERAAQLLAELKDPLRGELTAMLKQHRLRDAVKRYQQATGLQDLTLAVMVMNALDPEHPLGSR